MSKETCVYEKRPAKETYVYIAVAVDLVHTSASLVLRACSMRSITNETYVYEKRPAKETYAHIIVDVDNRAHISEAHMTYLQYA